MLDTEPNDNSNNVSESGADRAAPGESTPAKKAARKAPAKRAPRKATAKAKAVAPEPSAA